MIVVRQERGPVFRRASLLRSSGRLPTIRVGLVNNMPDSAFESTEKQFLDVMAAGSDDFDVHVGLYTLPGIDRSHAIRGHLQERYLLLDQLWDQPPDALVVTGTEPRAAHLTSEPYWDELAQLIMWAETATVSALLSCLAAHAAVLLFDGIERKPLPQKCSGVVANTIANHHPLLEGLGDPIPVPHSRLNDIPIASLEGHGYTTLIRSEASWTLAMKTRGRCLFLLSQGHPEYGTTSLLREYRRDVRRYLDGERQTYPQLPVGYLDQEAVDLLGAFEAAAVDPSSDGSQVSDFPYDHVARGLVNTWQQPAKRLFTNWLGEVLRRSRCAMIA